MGYRTRLGRVPKYYKDGFADMSADQVNKFFELANRGSPYYPYFHEELYEIGKYVNYPNCREPFYNFDAYETWECEFDILSKEGLLKIIEDQHEKIHSYFKDLSEGKEDVKTYLAQKVREWEPNQFRLKPYWLDEESNDGKIVRSWKYEYSIFNLTYIYRYFDWENDYLIYSAW